MPEEADPATMAELARSSKAAPQNLNPPYAPSNIQPYQPAPGSKAAAQAPQMPPAMPQYLPNGIQIAPYQPNAPGAALTVCGGFGGFGSIGAARADLCISGSISYTIPNRLPHKKPLNITRSPREKNDRSPTLISPYFYNSWLKESSALRQELEDRLAPSQAFA
ncbi:unnamed protein product [Symbiodinium necroappetens]|uniref:Uncharacterized protein n=1 Tax=Symbiodinium necroappetens TaxID=1628268 RepID=A0A812ZG14_9DINO|nr:unnamed protein product [Symbiodinium necroappetens]